jgi:hypothetical protein
MITVIPVTLTSGKAFAVVNPTTGLWGFRSSGNTVFAFTFEKATELAKKVTGWHTVPPQGFVTFGHGVPAAARPVATPAPAPRQDINGQEASKKPRTVAQAAAWLGVCERNLAKCEAGLIGGDVNKFRKAVETAKASLAAAQEREAPLANDNDDINA